MATPEARILPLPAQAVAQITASTAIASLPSVVLDLVRNALDARATTIAVTVDFPRRGCIVEDDGDGIHPADFQPGGGLGKPHHSSKRSPSPPAHGRSGAFLTALAALSLVTITSRHRHHPSHNTLIMHHAKPIARLIPAPAFHHLSHHDHGTRVVVRDLFGNLPVRLKQYARMVDLGNETDREWEVLRSGLMALLLAWDTDMRLSVTDSTRKRTLHLRSPSTHRESDSASSSRMGRLPRLLLQAGSLGGPPRSWVSLTASTPALSLDGTISLQPAPTKKLQFISIGITPLFHEGGHNVIYEEVNRLFAMSRFGAIEDEEELAEGKEDGRMRNGRYQRDGSIAKQLKMGRKGIDRWPVYTLKIRLVQSSPSRPTDAETILRAPRVGVKFPSRGRPPNQAFKRWQRTKSVTRALGSDVHGGGEPSAKPASTGETSTAVNAEAAGSRRQEGTDEVMEWADPRTKFPDLVNTRTGCSIPREFDRLHSAPTRSNRVVNSRRPPSQRMSTSRDDAASAEKRPGPWLEKVLSGWKNPVFPPTEPAIPQTTDGGSCGGEAHGFGDAPDLLEERISKDGLKHAQVIGQVDRKFILLKMVGGTGSIMLVLVDQHAADERCRIEELLAGLCSGETVALTPPIPFDTSNEEGRLFAKQRDHFARWGVEYQVTSFSTDRNEAAGGEVTVNALPVGIAQRCKAEPKHMIEMMRQEIWKRGESGESVKERGAQAIDDRQAWVQQIYDCPQGILALLSSRSCRSAIMFNDVLNDEECGHLISRLALCAFPFQCAHGRPSMTPLVNLGRSTQMGVEAGMGANTIARRPNSEGDKTRDLCLKWMDETL
ncbi:MAG: DNA mismatch repair protein [Thelocarpon superellum]|nr:MAG: DNA mismatch repair protein [Thelocarpon superellum]